MFHRDEGQLGLVAHDAELADPGVFLDGHVPGGVGGHLPLIAVAPVGSIHHAHGVGLQDAVIAEGGAAGHDMGLIPLRQGHGHPQGDQPEFPGLQLHGLRGPQVDPVRFPAHIAKGLQPLRQIFYLNFLDLFHAILQKMIISRIIYQI